MQEWRTWPFAPEPGTLLCRLPEIPDKGAREVVFGEGYDCFRVVLLRSGASVTAYRNRCAHVHIPLNYEPQLFHVIDGEVLMCAHHGAMYRIADGICFDGPCEGEKLTRIRLQSGGRRRARLMPFRRGAVSVSGRATALDASRMQAQPPLPSEPSNR